MRWVTVRRRPRDDLEMTSRRGFGGYTNARNLFCVFENFEVRQRRSANANIRFASMSHVAERSA